MASHIILALMLGMARRYPDLKGVFLSPSITEGVNSLLTDISSMFIIDGALIFILREIMVGIYQHKISAIETISLAVLPLVIGVIRTLAIVHSPKGLAEESGHWRKI